MNRPQSRYRRQVILLSSENEVPDIEDLPPSDLPLMQLHTITHTTITHTKISQLRPRMTFPLKIMLLFHYPRNRNRSSSLPAPMLIPQSDDIILTPRAERRYRMTVMTQRRLTTMAQNKVIRIEEAEEEVMRQERSKQAVFDEILQSLQTRGVTMAEFLKYVFSPDTQHTFDWKWQGFFRQKEISSQNGSSNRPRRLSRRNPRRFQSPCCCEKLPRSSTKPSS